MAMEEIASLRRAQPALAQRVFAKDGMDDEGYIETKRNSHCFQCRYLSAATNTCGIYKARPFECQLYPFLIVKEGERISLSVHLSCPHIQEHLNTKSFDEFVPLLKDFFFDEKFSQFLSRNEMLISDYEEYKNEMLHLFYIRKGKKTPLTHLFNQRLNIERLLHKRAQQLSSVSFQQLFHWQGFYEYDFKMINQCLCVFAKDDNGLFMFMPPVTADIREDVIVEAFNVMELHNTKRTISRIENVSHEQLQCFNIKEYAAYKKGYKYVYYKKDIAGLRGSPYKSQRHSYNHFVNTNRAAFVPYHEAMIDDCLALFDLWSKRKKEKCDDQISLQMIDENRMVLEHVLIHFEPLGLIGRVVKIDDTIKAFTFGYEGNDVTFCILFEITDLDVKGLSTFTFRQMCQDPALDHYAFINCMDDLGPNSVKQTKLHFKPRILWPTYTITKRT